MVHPEPSVCTVLVPARVVWPFEWQRAVFEEGTFIFLCRFTHVFLHTVAILIDDNQYIFWVEPWSE